MGLPPPSVASTHRPPEPPETGRPCDSLWALSITQHSPQLLSLTQGCLLAGSFLRLALQCQPHQLSPQALGHSLHDGGWQRRLMRCQTLPWCFLPHLGQLPVQENPPWHNLTGILLNGVRFRGSLPGSVNPGPAFLSAPHPVCSWQGPWLGFLHPPGWMHPSQDIFLPKQQAWGPPGYANRWVLSLNLPGEQRQWAMHGGGDPACSAQQNLQILTHMNSQRAGSGKRRSLFLPSFPPSFPPQEASSVFQTHA